jgi:pimeloyl-ACP methyl ester carboxylesterase
MSHHVTHTVEDGIERIVYTPDERRFETPILFQHGMWHGAWCWEPWQDQLAEWGWASTAYSLPGHAGSPVQRPIRWCTLGYYLEFLKAEIARFDTPPVVIGHSMGGALIQWYLKKAADDLPAAVLVAPWPAQDMLLQVASYALMDPVGTLISLATLSAAPVVRSPESAARALITKRALITPKDLHTQVGPESLLVLLQYNPLLWQPPRSVKTPLLWLAGSADAVIPERKQWRSAARYHADYVVIEGEAHNLMMEPSTIRTVETIHSWLVEIGIN